MTQGTILVEPVTTDNVVPIFSEEDIRSAYSGERFAAEYVKHRFESELNRMLHEKQVAAVNDVMLRERPERALEIAPGPGRLTRDVRPYADLTALEFNEGMILQGRRACSNHVHWVQGNAFDLPFQNALEFVYSFRFIRHFKSIDRTRLYAQVHKSLKADGVFLFDAVCERHAQPLRAAHPECYPIFDVLYQQEELDNELRSHGFTDVELRPVQKFYRLQYQSQVLLGPRMNWLNRLLIRGLERLPRTQGLEWIVTCRRA